MTDRHWLCVLRPTLIGLVAFGFAGSALAYVCHPDRPGTHRLRVNGRLDGYAMHGSRVAISFQAGGCARVMTWNPLTQAESGAKCRAKPDIGSVIGTGPVAVIEPGNTVAIYSNSHRLREYRLAPLGPPKRALVHAGSLVVLTDGDAFADRPDRLTVYNERTGALVRNWPLSASANTLDVARGVAALATPNGVYAVRLRDGSSAIVGVKYPGDAPQIEAPGIVYHDDLVKSHRASPSVLKFVPFRQVEKELLPAGPLHLPTTIGDFSLDGRTTLFVAHGSGGRCDRIGMWSIPWHFTITLMSEPPFCPEHDGGSGGITSIALGGQYFEAVTTYGKVQTLISSTIVRCVERVIARTSLAGESPSVRSIAADGPTLAFGSARAAGGGHVGFLSGMAPKGEAPSDSAPLQMSVFRHSVAVLRADGSIGLFAGQQLVDAYHPAGAQAIALRGRELVVRTRRTIDVFSLASGSLLHSWRVPHRASREIDVHFGVAVFTVGQRVFALRLANGRIAELVKTPDRVAAQIDDVGVVYRYNVRGDGYLGFIPFTMVDRKLR
jgi:hypothetical protein